MKRYTLLIAMASICSLTIAVQPVWSQVAETTAGMVDLERRASEWGASLSFDPLTGTGFVLRGQDLLRFKLGFASYMTGNGTLLRAAAPELYENRLRISQTTSSAIATWFADRDADRASRTTVVAILIDPGHGGKDPGAIGEHGAGSTKLRIAEKDIVLTIAKDLHARLTAKWPDKRIMITRAGDSYPSLDDRVEMANQVELTVNQAIIYVSVHANASFNKNASGYEVWYLNPDYRRTVVDSKKSEGVDKEVLPILNAMLEEEYTTESVYLAKSISGGLELSFGTSTVNRGVRADEWFVVRNARMPSVLVEVGFVTNEAEARLLSSEGHLRKLGDGIYNGIVSFVEYFERRKGPSAP
ncbi:MAG: N-acetylmuramoyl-L-alanine amidase [Spirochaetales bacterium]|nr:MAG: N-acetylmuramoyl-L-alanine amidase [Spirochaetales bacterium]